MLLVASKNFNFYKHGDHEHDNNNLMLALKEDPNNKTIESKRFILLPSSS